MAHKGMKGSKKSEYGKGGKMAGYSEKEMASEMKQMPMMKGKKKA